MISVNKKLVYYEKKESMEKTIWNSLIEAKVHSVVNFWRELICQRRLSITYSQKFSSLLSWIELLLGAFDEINCFSAAFMLVG